MADDTQTYADILRGVRGALMPSFVQQRGPPDIGPDPFLWGPMLFGGRVNRPPVGNMVNPLAPEPNFSFRPVEPAWRAPWPQSQHQHALGIFDKTGGKAGFLDFEKSFERPGGVWVHGVGTTKGSPGNLGNKNINDLRLQLKEYLAHEYPGEEFSQIGGLRPQGKVWRKF